MLDQDTRKIVEVGRKSLSLHDTAETLLDTLSGLEEQLTVIANGGCDMSRPEHRLIVESLAVTVLTILNQRVAADIYERLVTEHETN